MTQPPKSQRPTETQAHATKPPAELPADAGVPFAGAHRRMMDAETAEHTADVELRNFADAPANGAVISEVRPQFGRPPLLRLTAGPLAEAGIQAEVAWKWCFRTGLSYSVRMEYTTGWVMLSNQRPTIAEAIAEAATHLAAPKRRPFEISINGEAFKATATTIGIDFAKPEEAP